MATDSFTNTVDTALEAHNADWADSARLVTNLEISDVNTTRHEAAWLTSAARNTGSTEDESQIVFLGGFVTGVREVCVRMAAANTGYGLQLTGISGANYTTLDATENGSWIASIVNGTGAWPTADNHTVRASMSGSTLTAYVDAVNEGNTTDATITSGNPGFACGEQEFPNNAAFDDWDDLAAAAGGTQQLVSNLHRIQFKHLLVR